MSNGGTRQPGKRSGNRFRRGWKPEEIVAKIKEWVTLHGEPPRLSDWDPADAQRNLDELLARAALWPEVISRYEAGDWPSARNVAHVFGSWNAAIEAAGFVPRAQGQHTKRGTMPSARLLELGHVIGAVYEADRSGDEEGLRIALGQLASLARRIARSLEVVEAA